MNGYRLSSVCFGGYFEQSGTRTPPPSIIRRLRVLVELAWLEESTVVNMGSDTATAIPTRLALLQCPSYLAKVDCVPFGTDVLK